jgi:hypothetical protein
VGPRRRDAAAAPLALPAQRATVRMRGYDRRLGVRVNRWIPDEHLVDNVQPGAQTLLGRLEHMFASVERRPDGFLPA